MGIIYENGIKLYNEVNLNLITKPLFKLTDEKILKFKESNLFTASYDEITGILTDYELISTNENCGGYFDMYNKEIAYVSGGLPTIFHEIGHYIQAECEIFEKPLNVLSANVSKEQQCETIAYYMYNKIFPNKPLSKKYFDAYFNKEDIIFLKEWYENTLQDDIKINL